MEHLLNLLWLLVATAFFVTTVLGHARGSVKCSLPVALGCTALLVLILFPALSMTDDLQRAKMAAETNGRSDTLPFMRSLEDGPHHHGTVAFPMLLLLLMVASLMASAGSLLRRLDVPLSQRLARVRLEAVRPPPALCLL